MSLHVTAASDISTHLVGLRINYSVPGDRAADASGAGFEPLPEIAALNSGQWPFYWVAALDVKSVRTPGTVVVFGDSITDGRCSTRDGATLIVQPNLYQRWGDRDVLDRSGATHVVLFEGTNDITGGFTAAQIQAGTQTLIDKVHAAGMKIIASP